MNLLDVSQCPLHLAFRTCESLASDHNTALCGSEVRNWCRFKRCSMQDGIFPTAMTDEALVSAAVEALGLNRHHHFDPNLHIIEWALEKEMKS